MLHGRRNEAENDSSGGILKVVRRHLSCIAAGMEAENDSSGRILKAPVACAMPQPALEAENDPSGRILKETSLLDDNAGCDEAENDSSGRILKVMERRRARRLSAKLRTIHQGEY